MGKDVKITDFLKVFFPFTAFLMMATLTVGYYLLNVCVQKPDIFSETLCQTSQSFFANTVKLVFYEMTFISCSIFFYLFSFFPFVTRRISKYSQVFSLFFLFMSLFLIVAPFFVQVVPIPYNLLLAFSVIFDIILIYGIYKRIEN